MQKNEKSGLVAFGAVLSIEKLIGTNNKYNIIRIFKSDVVAPI